MTRFLSAFLAVFFLAVPALAEKDPVNTFFIGSVAIAGADSKKGRRSSAFSFFYKWNGACTRVSQNGDAFARIHQLLRRSLAVTATMRSAAAIPQASILRLGSIVDDKVYLNYSESERNLWSKDVPSNIAKGAANWPAVLKN